MDDEMRHYDELLDGSFGFGSQLAIQSDYSLMLLYYWCIDRFKTLNPGGQVISEKPMPLGEKQIRAVWARVETHPDYDGYVFHAVTKDGKNISNKDEQ